MANPAINVNAAVEDVFNVLMWQDLGNPTEHPNDEADDGEDNLDAIVEFDVDEGIQSDSPHDVAEFPLFAIVKKAADFHEEAPEEVLYCVTSTYVVVKTRSEDYILCHICYMVYAQRTPAAKHNHVDAHRTTSYSRCVKLLCNICKNRVFTIRPVDACMMCNDGEKTEV